MTTTGPVYITFTEVRKDPPHPCEIGLHRWAYLVGGGQACGRCGHPR